MERDATRLLETFTYIPINDGSDTDHSVTIRLLELLPGAPRSIIRTRLREFALSLDNISDLSRSRRFLRDQSTHKDSFAALSYEWGSPISETVSIHVNEQHFAIRPHLWSFLHQIRLQWADRLPIRLWVDSICINQADLEEKARQVRIMHKIYSQAREVLVWLGKEADLSGTVFAQLKRYIHELKSERTSVSQLFGYKAATSSRTGAVLSIMRNTAEYQRRQESLPSNLFRDDYTIRRALLKLCRRTYWTRAWIIQECLNARNVSLFCGDDHLPHTGFPVLGHLCWLIQQEEQHQPTWDEFLTSSGSEHYKTLDPATRVVELTRTWYGDRHNGLETLLQSYHGSQCGDPYDKVYAFLGLSSETGEFPVDYGISLHALLARTIVFCSDSKAKRKTNTVDPIKKTCDSIHVGQLLSEDFRLFHDLDVRSRLQRSAPDLLEQLGQHPVTIELDYLGKIEVLNDNGSEHRDLFVVNLRTYRALEPQFNTGDRAFALRGTSVVLIYRRTLRNLRFLGLGMLSGVHESVPLLGGLTPDEVDSRFDSLTNFVRDRIDDWDFPPPHPIPHYHLQHGQLFVFRMFRSLVLPLLPSILGREIMTQSADSGFYSSPSLQIPLKRVLEIISIWPKRVRGHEEYCDDLKLQRERDQKGLPSRVYMAVVDFALRLKNSVAWRSGL